MIHFSLVCDIKRSEGTQTAIILEGRVKEVMVDLHGRAHCDGLRNKDSL